MTPHQRVMTELAYQVQVNRRLDALGHLHDRNDGILSREEMRWMDAACAQGLDPSVFVGQLLLSRQQESRCA